MQKNSSNVKIKVFSLLNFHPLKIRINNHPIKSRIIIQPTIRIKVMKTKRRIKIPQHKKISKKVLIMNLGLSSTAITIIGS